MISSDKFLLIADKFLESDATVVQLSRSFNEFLEEAKLSGSSPTSLIKISSKCILKYLHCIIEYAGGGSAQARSATVRQLCNKICLAVDDLNIKHEFIRELSLPTFEILFGQPSWIAKEVLRMYSDTIQDSDRAVRLEAVQEKGPYYLGRLMDTVAFGDFEFQVLIVETLYRICTKEILNNMPEVYFLDKKLTDAFHKINTDEFDLTVRSFLNLLNEMDEHVASLLCNKVIFDDVHLQEPAELSSFKGMWVDFNVTAGGTITFFLNNEPFNKDIKWEMITVFPENIAKWETSFSFNEQKKRKEGIAKVFLKGACQLCYASSQHKLLKCRLMTLHSLDTDKFREVFFQVFPKMYKEVKAKKSTSLSYKRAYKPLDIVSVKSSTTNPSTCFNITIDSSLAGKKHKSKGGKSVTIADSTIATDISLLDYKSKTSAELDETCLKSNLSVLDSFETKKKVEKIGNYKSIRLSGLEALQHSSDELGGSKDLLYSEYNQEFLSNLLEMDEHLDMGRKGKPNLTQKEADSTTLVGGLYNSKIFEKDKPIASDIFHSIEDIDNDNIEESFESAYDHKWSKKKLFTNKKEEKRKPYSKVSRKKPESRGAKDMVGIYAKASFLGMMLSPDLFACESQEDRQDVDPKKTVEIPKKTFSKIKKSVLFSSQEPQWIDPVRDCQLEEFDKLKLGTPNIDLLEDKKLPEPDLIQISQPKYQSPLLTETEVYETARMDLDTEEVGETQSSERKMELFQDISQEQNKYLSSSQEDSPEENFDLNEEYKSRIVILSDVQIQSPSSRSPLSQESTQKSQKKKFMLRQKENIAPAKEIEKNSQELKSAELHEEKITQHKKKKIKRTIEQEYEEKLCTKDLTIKKIKRSQSPHKETIEETFEKNIIAENEMNTQLSSDTQKEIETTKITIEDNETKIVSVDNEKDENINVEVIEKNKMDPSHIASREAEELMCTKDDNNGSFKDETEEKENIKSDLEGKRINESSELSGDIVKVCKKTISKKKPKKRQNLNLPSKATLKAKKIKAHNVEFASIAPIPLNTLIATSQINENDLPLSELKQLCKNEMVSEIPKLKLGTDIVPSKSNQDVITEIANSEEINVKNETKKHRKDLKKGKTHNEKLRKEDNDKNECDSVMKMNDNTESDEIKDIPWIELKQSTLSEMQIFSRKNSNLEKTEVDDQAKQHKKDLDKENTDNDNSTQEDVHSDKIIHNVMKINDEYSVNIDNDEIDDIPLSRLNRDPIDEVQISSQKHDSPEEKKIKHQAKQHSEDHKEEIIHNENSTQKDDQGNKDDNIIIHNVESNDEYSVNIDIDEIDDIPLSQLKQDSINKLQISPGKHSNSENLKVKYQVNHEEEIIHNENSTQKDDQGNKKENIFIHSVMKINDKYSVNTDIDDIDDIPLSQLKQDTINKLQTSPGKHDNSEETKVKQHEKEIIYNENSTRKDDQGNKNKNILIHNDEYSVNKERDELDDIPLSQLKQDLSKELQISPQKHGDSEKTKVKNQTKQCRKENIHNGTSTQEEVHDIKIDNDENDDIPLSELKQFLRNKSFNENKKSTVDEKVESRIVKPTKSQNNKDFVSHAIENTTFRDKTTKSAVYENTKSRFIEPTNSLVNKKCNSQAEEKTKELVHKNDKSLVEKSSKSQLKDKAKTPVVKMTKSNLVPSTKSLVKKNTKSVVDENSKSQVRGKNESLVDKNTESPFIEWAESLVKENTKSPVDKQGKSQVGETRIDGNAKSQVERISNAKSRFTESTKLLVTDNTKSLVNANTKSVVNKNAKPDVEEKSTFEKQIKEKINIYQNDTLEQIASDKDNGSYLAASPIEDFESQKAKETLPNKSVSRQSDKKITESIEEFEDERYLLNKRTELFEETPENPPCKKVCPSKPIDETGNNDKRKKIEMDELEKSLHLLFGTESSEPVPEINPEIVRKNNESLNITLDTTNSIQTGNVGLLKRGRKLFDPENMEENFLTCSIIDEELANELEEKQTGIKSKREFAEEKQAKNKKESIKVDKEIKKANKKISSNLLEDAQTSKKNHKKHREKSRKEKEYIVKSKRSGAIQKNHRKLSELEYNNYARKKRLDAFYDKVFEKLKSENTSPRKSYLPTPKKNKSKNNGVGKYNLDFSAVHESIIEKKREKNALRLKHSSKKGISEADGDDSKERNVIMEDQDISDEEDEMQVILKGIGTLCRYVAKGTLKKPSPSIQKILFSAASLLLEK